MKQEHLQGIVRKRYKATTDSSHKLPVAGNVLDRNFTTTRESEAWASDIAYMATGEGWLYLTAMMDLFDRKVIGWAFSGTATMRSCGRRASQTQHGYTDMLNNKVLTFYHEEGINLLRILTDRGTEYCGAGEQHGYQLYLNIEDIDHARTKAKSPQTNGICERSYHTM